MCVVEWDVLCNGKMVGGVGVALAVRGDAGMWVERCYRRWISGMTRRGETRRGGGWVCGMLGCHYCSWHDGCLHGKRAV